MFQLVLSEKVAKRIEQLQAQVVTLKDSETVAFLAGALGAAAHFMTDKQWAAVIGAARLTMEVDRQRAVIAAMPSDSAQSDA